MNNLGLIIQREYYERVKRKSFIITTLLVPIVMLGVMVAPALFMIYGGQEEMTIQVVDNTGRIAQNLKGNDEIKFVATTDSVEKLRANENIESILIINSTAITDPQKGVSLLTRGSVPMMTDTYISDQVSRAIEDARLQDLNKSDVRQVLEDVKADITLTTIRMDKEEDTETSSGLSYFLSLTMDLMLYMFILLYGQMVMTSIIEEKNNRVLEIVVSSAKPFHLMMGKIAGVGLVAITQILIWAVLIGAGVMAAVPFLTPENMGSEASPELMGAISQFTDGGFLLGLLINALLFFIGGFLFYASLFAAIGSAVSNVQDASQLSTIATLPIIIAIVGSMAVLNNPDSTMAIWLSIIPFTSPMTMMARLPYGVPIWQTAVSLVVLYLSFMFMIWLCGKIYRVGIFMYGKKPSISDLIKWARYK